MRRLSRAGFKKDFVCPAILPDWWDDSCTDDPDILPELEIRVARFLRRSILEIRDPSVVLTAPSCAGAQLRRVHDIDRDRLAPAIHAALQIAGAVIRSLRNPGQTAIPPLRDALRWRQEIQQAMRAVTLDDILGNLWSRGVPVIPVETLPMPNFQGLACVVEGRPVILLGHKHDEPGRVAYIVAHEAGHIANGDCLPGQPVIDEAEDVPDSSDMERDADLFATLILTGQDAVPQIAGTNYRQLASEAFSQGRTTGIEAGILIWAWARRSRDYTTASMALKALYLGTGARTKLRQHFDQFVNLDSATESDRSLLRCVYGDPGHNAAVD